MNFISTHKSQDQGARALSLLSSSPQDTQRNMQSVVFLALKCMNSEPIFRLAFHIGFNLRLNRGLQNISLSATMRLFSSLHFSKRGNTRESEKSLYYLLNSFIAFTKNLPYDFFFLIFLPLFILRSDPITYFTSAEL